MIVVAGVLHQLQFLENWALSLKSIHVREETIKNVAMGNYTVEYKVSSPGGV